MIDNDLCQTPQATEQSILNRSSKDKFFLVLNLPRVLKQEAQTNSKLKLDPLQMSIHGAVFPSVQVPPVEVRFSGQSYNVSSHSRPNYDPLTVNFIIDNKFINYWILWKWLNVLNSAKMSTYTGKTMSRSLIEKVEEGNLNDYQTNMSIYGLNEYNEKIIEGRYFNAFITRIGSINYSYRDSEIIESTAEFQFSQFDVTLLQP